MTAPTTEHAPQGWPALLAAVQHETAADAEHDPFCTCEACAARWRTDLDPELLAQTARVFGTAATTYAAMHPRQSEPTLFYSYVSPESLSAAKEHIRAVMGDLKRLSKSINAYASDDAFDEPNPADLAIEKLALALAELGGTK